MQPSVSVQKLSLENTGYAAAGCVAQGHTGQQHCQCANFAAEKFVVHSSCKP